MTQRPAFHFSTFKNYNIGEIVAGMPSANVLVVGILVADKWRY